MIIWFVAVLLSIYTGLVHYKKISDQMHIIFSNSNPAVAPAASIILLQLWIFGMTFVFATLLGVDLFFVILLFVLLLWL